VTISLSKGSSRPRNWTSDAAPLVSDAARSRKRRCSSRKHEPGSLSAAAARYARRCRGLATADRTERSRINPENSRETARTDPRRFSTSFEGSTPRLLMSHGDGFELGEELSLAVGVPLSGRVAAFQLRSRAGRVTRCALPATRASMLTWIAADPFERRALRSLGAHQRARRQDDANSPSLAVVDDVPNTGE